MTINRRTKPYTEIPPNRAQPVQFPERADYMAGYMPGFGDDLNVMADEFNATAVNVNNLEQSAKNSKESAEAAALVANSASNIKGVFKPGQTNALQNETWIYEGAFWFALTDTSTTPQESSSDWASLSKHSSTTGRDESGAHPASAIDGVVEVFDTVADMKAATWLKEGQAVYRKGYYSAGDGGHAKLLIKGAVEYGRTPDGFGDYYVSGGTSLVAVLEAPNNNYDVDQFGAVKYDGVSSKQENAAINNLSFSACITKSWEMQSTTSSNGGHYCVSSKFLVKQLSPVNAWPYTNNQSIILNSVIENVGTNYWLQIESQNNEIKITEQRGGQSSLGVYVTKQGDPYIKIGTSREIPIPVVYEDAYSHTLYPGLSTATNTALLLKDSNAIKVIGGRLGGNFTLDNTDETTANIGIDIQAGAANHIIGTNIEYCKQTDDSWAIKDSGTSTYYAGGYLESCSGGLIKAEGRNGRFDIQTLATGVYNQDGIKDTGQKNAFHLQTTDTYIYPNSDTSNATLAFVYPALSYRVNQSTKISGPNKQLVTTPKASVWNKLHYSANPSNNAWVVAPLSGFTGGSVNYNAVGDVSLGFPLALELTLPKQDSIDKQYYVSQTGSHLFLNQGSVFTAGAYFVCDVGKVDVMIKVNVDGFYFTHRFSVAQSTDGKSNAIHWEALEAKLGVIGANNPTYIIYFRPTEDSVIRLFGLSFYEYTDVGALPPTDGTNTQTVSVAHDDERNFPNGMFLNGSVRMNSKFLESSFTLTELTAPLYITGLSQTLPNSTRTKGKVVVFKNVGGSTISLSASASNIDGLGSLSLPAKAAVTLYSDGTEYWTL